MSSGSLSTLSDALNWRYATKVFDASRSIDGATWQALEQALVLAPSSFGLQPWKFIVVRNSAIREKLVEASWGQTQPRDASHFVVFAVKENLGDDHLDRYMARTAEVRGVPMETLDGFRKVIAQSLEGARAEGRLDAWQTRQLYIALGQFMTAAALLGVDTCPMEGLVPARYDTALGLAGTGWKSVFACAAGYRSPDDKYATVPKVRFETHEVIEHR
ncbi:NAD(P)H-dependent oxidoreductase [Synoicihabitans lomoniglobus]|uniref:NAD(P)H-dependent oxidoreductase n=1 Tax=Synoicihabitans lomoniglobus TaxID=2909285 RepID=A0AAF0CQM8_9BACT|nr:NAD(P)H-dependent oxidoreductase [Opitutaceae bacterium LMO-M01]WED66201.1 NAD(P)H-dependent oxidoreductase [Opitutaceae bacterium LMO-M01]